VIIYLYFFSFYNYISYRALTKATISIVKCRGNPVLPKSLFALKAYTHLFCYLILYKFYLFIDRDEFQLGSLSHFLNVRAVGYMDLPSFPAVAPDPNVRNVEPPRPVIPVTT